MKYIEKTGSVRILFPLSVHLNEIMMVLISALHKANTPSWIFIMLPH